MMFLISRNIEENAKQRGNTNTNAVLILILILILIQILIGETCEDAYRMVFDHEKMEGKY